MIKSRKLLILIFAFFLSCVAPAPVAAQDALTDNTDLTQVDQTDVKKKDKDKDKADKKNAAKNDRKKDKKKDKAEESYDDQEGKEFNLARISTCRRDCESPPSMSNC